jgi:hypothetical protein
MPTVLLPASAAAFAPRSPSKVVLNTEVEPWLTATLKRLKRTPTNVAQCTSCLTEMLSLPSAIWTLCSLLFPKVPETEVKKDEGALVKYQMVHIKAYVVYVDMVSRNEVAFKLTPKTIDALVEFHKEVFSVAASNTWDWFGKESPLKKMQGEFVQTINEFVYRTNAQVLEGLEDDGAGELFYSRSAEAKAAIMSFFIPLFPPPPQVPDIIHPTIFSPSSVGYEPLVHNPMERPMHIEPFSPNTASAGNSYTNVWPNLGSNGDQLSSPTLSYSRPYTTPPYNESHSISATSAFLPVLPFPSMLV